MKTCRLASLPSTPGPPIHPPIAQSLNPLRPQSSHTDKMPHRRPSMRAILALSARAPFPTLHKHPNTHPRLIDHAHIPNKLRPSALIPPLETPRQTNHHPSTHLNHLPPIQRLANHDAPPTRAHRKHAPGFLAPHHLPLRPRAVRQKMQKLFQICPRISSFVSRPLIPTPSPDGHEDIHNHQTHP
jgi:hypothetical protein